MKKLDTRSITALGLLVAVEIVLSRFCSINAWDLDKSIQQTEKLKTYRDKTGRTLWICHDAKQWYDVKKFPEYYE